MAKDVKELIENEKATVPIQIDMLKVDHPIKVLRCLECGTMVIHNTGVPSQILRCPVCKKKMAEGLVELDLKT